VRWNHPLGDHGRVVAGHGVSPRRRVTSTDAAPLRRARSPSSAGRSSGWSCSSRSPQNLPRPSLGGLRWPSRAGEIQPSSSRGRPRRLLFVHANNRRPLAGRGGPCVEGDT
jgi:hypothetical protein